MHLAMADTLSTALESRELLLQRQQVACRDRYYASFYEGEVAKMDRHEALQAPSVKAAQAAYDETVRQLDALLGPEAHCNRVDSDLWSTYSDAYKDTYGYRPRFHQTRAQVQCWLKLEDSAEMS